MADQSPQLWNVLGLLNWTQGYFARTGLDVARLAAEVLLAHVLGCERISLYTRFDYQPAPAELADFRRLVERAARREPIAYLVGEKEFYSLRLKVTPDVLIPRPETEILVEQAVGHLRRLGRACTVWDVCAGSGCVAVAVAANVAEATVLVTDISPPAVALAEENAATHKLTARIRCRQADLLDLPGDCGDMSPFDVLACNPPYVAETDEVAQEVAYEPSAALYAGEDGLECIRPLIHHAAEFIASGGAVAMEFGCGQADVVRNLLADTGQFAEPEIIRDRQGIERAAVAIKKSPAP
ncbi:MAG: peptide chain release factor N(5)-glutamine methyltransferase [Planctomycetota bacterium]|nr:peptide chain release factor N(5)-glutamine methyltransferase [Planctomycetota bacterium]